jgi:hypothetical protein
MSSTFSPTGGSPAQTCQRCQAHLSPLEVICGRCGYQNNSGQSNMAQPQNQPSSLENSGISAPKKGLLQQYASQQGSQISAAPGNSVGTPPAQPQVGTNSSISSNSSGINFAPYQPQTSGMFKSQPDSGQLPPPGQPPAMPYQPQTSGMFKSQPGSGQLQPPSGQPPAMPYQPQPPGTSLSMFKPGTSQFPPVYPSSYSNQPLAAPTQQADGNYSVPPMAGAGPSGATGANLYGTIPSVPPQGRNTDALGGGGSGFFSGGPMSASRPMPSAPLSSISRPMPSAPMSASRPMPSMGYRTQTVASIPRAPLGSEEDENPHWARLAIIVVLLVVLAGGGYFGFVRLMSQDSSMTTTVQKVVSYQPKGTPLFSDNFASNTYGWNLQNDGATFITTLGNNALTLECNTNKLLWELVPGSRTYDNFQVAFDATFTKGDQNNGYGVYIRGTANATSDLASYYRFELYGDASYAVFKGTPNAAGTTVDTKLVDYTGSALINKKGKVNHILIIANGPKLTFMVNGQVLKTVTDASYTTGTIALFVSNLPNANPGAQAQFSKFAIYPYPMK